MKSAFRQQLPRLTGGFDQYLEFGVDARTHHAFWLSRQVMSRPWQASVQRRTTLGISQAAVGKSLIFQDTDAGGVYRPIPEFWPLEQYNSPAGSFLSSDEELLQGRMFTKSGQATWCLRGSSPVSAQSLYWPSGGMRCQPTQWLGEVNASGQSLSGLFVGARVQYWGRLAPIGMALLSVPKLGGDAQVQLTAIGQFAGRAGALSERLNGAVGILRVGHETYHFDRWWPAGTVAPSRLDAYRWMATLASSTHRLELVADGGNPRVTPWQGLVDYTPEGLRQLLRITPYAAIHARLFERGSQVALHEWRNDEALLMTLAGDAPHLPEGPSVTL
jgi:hypothetical protein